MLGGPVPPVRPQLKYFCTRGEYFTMSNGVFNFNFLALVFSEISEGPQIYTRGPYGVFLALLFPRYYGVQNLHHEALRSLDARQRRNFCTQSEYFTTSNCVFNFNILALVVSDILWGLKFTLGALCPPARPQRKMFCTRGEYFTMSNGVFNFYFLALLLSGILGGPKFTLGGPTPTGRPLAEKFLYPKRVLYNI